jgi:hypothetical protein
MTASTRIMLEPIVTAPDPSDTLNTAFLSVICSFLAGQSTVEISGTETGTETGWADPASSIQHRVSGRWVGGLTTSARRIFPSAAGTR